MTGENTFNTTKAEDRDLYALAIDIWTLERKIHKTKKEVGEDTYKSIANSFNKLRGYLDRQNVEIFDLTGKKYDDGLNVDVLSVISEGNDSAIITETIEPMVKHNSRVVKRAKVIVTK
jgi:molecular chaperone GrpE (heat shock protein)